MCILLVTSANSQVTTYYNAKGKVVKLLEKADSYTVVGNDSIKESRILEQKYSKSGQILSESRYLLKDSKVKIPDGLNKEWYENGQLHLEVSYNMNKLNGKLMSYSINGKMIRNEEYENDIFLFDGKRLNSAISNSIFEQVEQMPTFIGGAKALNNYIYGSLKYPEKSKKNGIEGTILVRFVINEVGDVAYVHIIRGLDSYCNDEAVRIVKKMPRWTPGKQNGFIVSTFEMLQIHFSL